MIRAILRVPSRSSCFSNHRVGVKKSWLLSNINAFATTTPQAPTTMTADKMEKDKRYQAVSEVPENVLNAMNSNIVHSPGFSIKVLKN